jgi:hypothetical protein
MLTDCLTSFQVRVLAHWEELRILNLS